MGIKKGWHDNWIHNKLKKEYIYMATSHLIDASAWGEQIGGFVQDYSNTSVKSYQYHNHQDDTIWRPEKVTDFITTGSGYGFHSLWRQARSSSLLSHWAKPWSETMWVQYWISMVLKRINFIKVFKLFSSILQSSGVLLERCLMSWWVINMNWLRALIWINMNILNG